MNRTSFKAFKEAISTCDEDAPVWYAGYLWLDLTKRQGREVIEILINRGFPIVYGIHGKMVKIPSGLGIWIDQQ